MILWKLILRWTFRATHDTFLVVFVIAFVVLVNLASGEYIHPTGPLIRWYQHLSGAAPRNSLLIGVPGIGDLGWRQ